jgi:hypothetical protein
MFGRGDNFVVLHMKIRAGLCKQIACMCYLHGFLTVS